MKKVRFTFELLFSFTLTFLVFGMSLSLFAQDSSTPNIVKKKVIVKKTIDENGNVQTETFETEVDVDTALEDIEGDFDIDINVEEDENGTIQKRIVKVRVDGDGELPASLQQELEGMGIDINILEEGEQQMIIIDTDENTDGQQHQDMRIFKMKQGDELPEELREKLEKNGINLNQMRGMSQEDRFMRGIKPGSTIDKETQILRVSSIDDLSDEVLAEIKKMGVSETDLRQRFAEAKTSVRITKEGLQPVKVAVDATQDVEPNIQFFGESGEQIEIKTGGEMDWMGKAEELKDKLENAKIQLEEIFGNYQKDLKLPGGKKAFLGITMEKATTDGVVISDIVEHSAAEAASLKSGDVITALDGKKMNRVDDVIEHIQSLEVGDALNVTYLRNGQNYSTIATLKGNAFQPLPRHFFKENKPFIEHDLRIATKRGHLGVNLSQDATILKVTPESPASDAGIEAGDQLLKIGELDISNAEDVSCAMRQALPGTNAEVTFERDGREQTVTVIPGLQPVRQQHCSPGDKTAWMERMKAECEERCGTPFLGLYMEAKDSNFETYDVLITGIVQNTGAEDAGILKGDVITKVEGQSISKINDVVDIIRAREPGDVVKLVLDRNGKKKRIKATLSNMTQSDLFSPCDCETGEINTRAMTTKEIIIFKGEAQPETPQLDITPDRLLSLDNVELFPNPNNGIFTAKFESSNKVPTTVAVVDVNGKEVYREIINDFDGRYDNRINISNQSKGTYFLNIIQGDKIFTQTFVYGKERY